MTSFKLHGKVTLDGEAGMLIRGYTDRKFFASLGYTQDFSTLDCFTANCFNIIGEIDATVQPKKKGGKK